MVYDLLNSGMFFLCISTHIGLWPFSAPFVNWSFSVWCGRQSLNRLIQASLGHLQAILKGFYRASVSAKTRPDSTRVCDPVCDPVDQAKNSKCLQSSQNSVHNCYLVYLLCKRKRKVYVHESPTAPLNTLGITMAQSEKVENSSFYHKYLFIKSHISHVYRERIYKFFLVFFILTYNFLRKLLFQNYAIIMGPIVMT